MSDKAPAKAPEAEGEGAPAKKKMAGKTMILFIVLPVLLILIGVGAGMMMMGGGKDKKAEVASAEDAHGAPAKDEGHGKKEEKKEDAHGEMKDAHGAASGGEEDGPTRETGTLQVGSAGEPSYYMMPDLLVNLASQEGDRQLFLKLKLTLEAQDPEMFADIDKLLPRITDQYQMFLRELRVDDLNGSAGGYRLRLELLRRINLAIAPAKVDAVLIEEMLVQ